MKILTLANRQITKASFYTFFIQTLAFIEFLNLFWVFNFPLTLMIKLLIKFFPLILSKETNQ